MHITAIYWVGVCTSDLTGVLKSLVYREGHNENFSFCQLFLIPSVFRFSLPVEKVKKESESEITFNTRSRPFHPPLCPPTEMNLRNSNKAANLKKDHLGSRRKAKSDWATVLQTQVNYRRQGVSRYRGRGGGEGAGIYFGSLNRLQKRFAFLISCLSSAASTKHIHESIHANTSD